MTELRTFADKKGALKAAKRDAHNLPQEVLLLDLVAREVDGRFGVEVILDHVSTDVLDLKAVEGFQITYAGKAVEPAPVAPKDKKPKPAPKDKPAPVKRRSGEVNVSPMKTLVAARAGSKQDLIIGLLVKGATLDQLRTVCTKADGTVWDDNSIRSALYYDVHQKGYGVRTVWEGDVATYWLVLPAGVAEPMPAKVAKS